jgi:hypothetical protein
VLLSEILPGSMAERRGTVHLTFIKFAWRKKNTVAADLQNQNWTRGFWRMSNAEEMAEFITLWDMLQRVHLSNVPDYIRWRWTASGTYSSKSAYRIQFQDSFSSFNTTTLWSAHAEGKHKFFTWLLVQSKVLTADKLLARNWPCNPTCILCDQAPEMAVHLCLQCVFAREVWHLVATWSDDLIQAPAQDLSLEAWWNASLSGHSQHHRRMVAAIQMYTTWNLWEERNRRSSMASS